MEDATDVTDGLCEAESKDIGYFPRVAKNMEEQGNGSIFIELLDHEPDLPELEDFGVFESTSELVTAYKASLPEELAPPPPSPFMKRQIPSPSTSPLLPLHISTRDTTRSSPASPRPSSPLAIVRRAAGLRPRLASRHQSTSDIPTVPYTMPPLSPDILAPPRFSFSGESRSAPSEVSQVHQRVRHVSGPQLPSSRVWSNNDTTEEVTVVVQELRSSKRKLKKPRPISATAFPLFSTSLSTEPDSFRPNSPSMFLSQSPSSKRRSWRVSFSKSSSLPSSPLDPGLSFPSSPLSSFSPFISQDSPLPPNDRRKSKRDQSTESSEDSYHGDMSEGASNSKWVNALAGRLGWSGRKALKRTGSSNSGGSSSWEVVTGEPGVDTGRRPSFEVLGRPPIERSKSTPTTEEPRDALMALVALASASSPNLTKINEHPEPDSMRRSLLSSFPPSSASQEATPIPSPSLDMVVSRTSSTIPSSQPIEFPKVELSHSRTVSVSASLLTASRPTTPPTDNSAPILPFKAREIFLAQREDDGTSSDEETDGHSQGSAKKSTPRSAPSCDEPRFSFLDSSPSKSYAQRGLVLRRSRSLIEFGPRRRKFSGSEDLSLNSTASSTSDDEETQASSADQGEEDDRGDLTPGEQVKLAERLARSLQPGVTVGNLWTPGGRREASDKSGELLGEEGYAVEPLENMKVW